MLKFFIWVASVDGSYEVSIDYSDENIQICFIKEPGNCSQSLNWKKRTTHLAELKSNIDFDTKTMQVYTSICY